MLPLHQNDPQHKSRSGCSSKEASQEVYLCENGDRQTGHRAGHPVCLAKESVRLRRRIRLHYVVAGGIAAAKKLADSEVELIASRGTNTASWQRMASMVVLKAATLTSALVGHVFSSARNC